MFLIDVQQEMGEKKHYLGNWSESDVGFLFKRQTHLPLALLSEDLSLSYIHPVPGYSQLQLPIPAFNFQEFTGSWGWKENLQWFDLFVSCLSKKLIHCSVHFR